MKEKFLKKMGFAINSCLAAIGGVSGLIGIYAPEEHMVKEFFQFVTGVCIVLLTVMFVMYLTAWFENGMQVRTLLNEISNFKKESAYFLGTSNGQKTNFCPVKTSSYVENSEDVSNELYKLLKDKRKEIEELDIICFGRNGFGGAVKYIIERNINIRVRIIVFNAKSHPDICQPDDETIIKRNIEEWLKGSKRIEVIMSDIPPMVRAAVAYTLDKEGSLHAIWGTMQSYRFAFDLDGKKISLEKPTNSLISICEENKTVSGDFNMLINSFEEEFDRLEENSQTAKLVSKGRGKSEVVFEERIHE